MNMAANKVQGVRAAVVSDTFSARMASEHNDARVLCIGARVVGSELAWACVDAWLGAEFGGGRHQRRVDKIAG
jgi:ribose 5-phosphate isomerase B